LESTLDALSKFSPGSLLEDPRKVDSPIYLVILGVFVLVFALGLVLAIGARRLSRGNRLHGQLLARYGAWGGWLGGVGMLVIGLRYTNVPLFSKRLWTILNVFAVFAVALHLVWYRIRRYPAEIAAYREDERRRRFLPSRTNRPPRRPQARRR
jgi:hypothetical protein